MRKRVMPVFTPQWNSEIETWTAGRIKLNLWRFDRVEDFDDIMQQAKLLFFILGKKYPIAKNLPHFFTLYKVSLLRMFHDKSCKKSRSSPDEIIPIEDAVWLQGTPNFGHFNLLLAELPEEMQIVLRALTCGRVRLKLDRPTKTFAPRENHNMRLKRRFSLAAEDPVGDLRGYFANT